MKILFLFPLFFLYTSARSQSVLDIKYEQLPLNFQEVNTANFHSWATPIKLRMVANDSFCLVFCRDIPKELRRNQKQLGDKLVNHGYFHDFMTGKKFSEIKLPKDFTYFAVNIPDTASIPEQSITRTTDYHYLVEDSLFASNWQLLDLQKTILKRNCRAALAIDKNNDSIMVWYTMELAFKKGFLWYDGLPGIVLEVYDQKRNVHVKATGIKEKNIRIIPPQEGTKVSAAEWAAIRKTIPVKRFEPATNIKVSVH